MIYLDNAATTVVLPEVVQAMQAVLTGDFGNPSSRHPVGLAAQQQLRQAREVVAAVVGAPPPRVLFTSGGTEANALAILGTAHRQRRRGGHLLVSAIEHPSVLASAGMLEREGFTVEQIPVTRGGWVEPVQVMDRLRPETVIVALMHVNNETGIEQPVHEVARELHARGTECQLLVDAVQSLPALPVSLELTGADLLTLSAHKIHGPKGVGCLVLGPRAEIAPLWGGGDQEQLLRPGTENLPGIVGFARALQLPRPDPRGLERMTTLLLDQVVRARPQIYPVGDASRRAPHIVTLGLPGVSTEVLINVLHSMGVCASSGSACHSRRSLRSHVAQAMQLPPTHGIVRISLSSTTTEDEVERAAGIICAALAKLCAPSGPARKARRARQDP